MKKIIFLLRMDFKLCSDCSERFFRIAKLFTILFMVEIFSVFESNAYSRDTFMNDASNQTVLSAIDGQNDATAVPQQQRITGTVYDSATGEPLSGVTVLIDGTVIGTITGADGKYTIQAPKKDGVVVFSFIGYTTQKVTYSGQSVVDIKLTTETNLIDEIVVIGYGTQKKTTITGAVSAVKGDEIVRTGASDISSTMAGKVAGLSMEPTSGLPGESPIIHIRGVGTTGSGSPLVVIDGIIRNNMGQIDPSIIESVSVLKDAAAVAPYGLGGANGVILITTKKGNNSAPTLTVDSYYGVETPTWLPHTINAVEYMKLQNEAGSGSYSTEYLNNYNALHAADPDKYPDSNPRDLLKKRYTPVQNYQLNLSGGSEKTNYFIGAGYFKEQNLFEKIYYNRYNFNVNIDSKVTNTTKVSINVINSFEQRNDYYPPKPGATSMNYGNCAGTLIHDWYKQTPIDPMMFSNGLPASDHGTSFAGLLNSNSYNRENDVTLLNTITVDQQLPFIKGLSVKGSFSYDTKAGFVKGFGRPIVIYNVDYSTTPYTYSKTFTENEGQGLSKPFLNEISSKNQLFTYQGFVNYQRTFGAHDISLLGVAELRKSNYYQYNASIQNYIIDIDEFNMGSSDKTDLSVGGYSSEAIQVGYVYRLAYVYSNKYMAEVSGRYDGSYYFARGKRFAFFPAFSLGWRLSEENFMKNLTFINNLKIRASWGKTGNLAGTPYQYLAGYELVANQYAFGTGSMVSGANQQFEANPNITWEVSKKSDIGFEANLWNSLLTIEADYFFERRNGMLLPPATTVPFEYGIALADENKGIMENRGIELTVGTKHQFKNGLKLGLDGNFSYTKNKMIEIFETASTYNNPNRRRTGRPYLTNFGYHALGLFSTADDKNGDGIINSADGYNVKQFGDVKPGDIKYADINGDGIIDANDEVKIGDPQYPAITYGFTPNAEWKGFDLSLFFQGAAISSIDLNGKYQTVPFLNDQSNTDYEYYDNRWTPENQNAKYPRSTLGMNANNGVESDFWYHSRAYLRLKNLVFGYTIPKRITQSGKINNIRVYFSGTNIFTFSKLKIFDPEMTLDAGIFNIYYPPVKMFSFGASITF